MKKKSNVKKSKGKGSPSPKKGKGNKHTTKRWTTPDQRCWAGKNK